MHQQRPMHQLQLKLSRLIVLKALPKPQPVPMQQHQPQLEPIQQPSAVLLLIQQPPAVLLLKLLPQLMPLQ